MMHITADTSQYHYKAGETWFEGNVAIDQGSTHLRADRVVTTKNGQNQIQEAIAYGKSQPAHYWTQPKKEEKILHAYANIMKIYPLESRAVLLGNVEVTQGGNHFHGQVIIYNIKKQIITVPPAKNSRATMVIEAEQLKQVL